MLQTERAALDSNVDLSQQDDNHGGGYERESRWVETDDEHSQSWPKGQDQQ